MIKLIVETTSLADLKEQLEEALIDEAERHAIFKIHGHLKALSEERDSMLLGVQQCAQAVHTMTERIPKAYKLQMEICEAAEDLIRAIQAHAPLMDALEGNNIEAKDVRIKITDLQILLTSLREET